jgi:hypothetical protein
MALWNVNGEIVYSEGALSVSNPPSNLWVKRHAYKVPYSNVGKGGILNINGKTYHTPSWIEVHPKTTVNDIMVEKNPFEELFVEEKRWSFKSGSSDKEYTVRHNAKGNLSCDCMGYIGHGRCKHIKEVSSQIVA